MATNNAPVRIYRMNDCDWYVARSLEEAKAQALMDYGPDEEEMVAAARELTDEEMNSHMYWASEDTDKCDPRHWKCSCGYTLFSPSPENRWTGKRWEHLHGDGKYEPMACISEVPFVQELGKHLAQGLPVPGLFASTEH